MREDIKAFFSIIENNKNKKFDEVPVGVSGRHIHVSQNDLEILFGKDYELSPLKDLSQPGQFAAEETLAISGPMGIIENVRILGPTRDKTQVEILMSDTYKLGIKGEIRQSGDLKHTPGLTLIGPKGAKTLEEGVIVAIRHIHINSKDLENYGLYDGQVVKVKVEGIRSGIMDNVIVRANTNSALDFHIDMEEANAFGLKNKDIVKIIK